MTIQPIQILLVDDEEKLLHSIAQRMRVLGFLPYTAVNGKAAIEIAIKQPIDVAIVDLLMPDMDGLVTITKLKEIKPNLKTILLTGHGNDKVKQATESLNTLYFEKDEMGDFWRFIKKLNNDGKIVVIQPADELPHSRTRGGNPAGRYPANTVEIHTSRTLSNAAKQLDGMPVSAGTVGDTERYRIIGETMAMQRLRKNIARVASLDCTVTLRGEAGTGKELVARAIHAGSMRHNYRFLAINCQNLGSDKLAGQLLGYKNSNLYEAIQSSSGIFSAGRVGTLLFDQIDQMPVQMQEQLLKILDVIDNRRIGDSKEASLDIRILVSTQLDRAQQENSGSLKSELFDRLKLLELTIPPLRERKDDIHPLSQYFLDKYRLELRKQVDSISPQVVKILVGYDFPGNVRELKHIIERAVILADSKSIKPEHLPVRFFEELKKPNQVKAKHFPTLAEMEMRYIVEVLEATNGNKSKSSEILGISRAALWRKIKQLKNDKSCQ